tara:strand:+ start:119 stop:292 length:174 start_codon:yes stop_codon:yes gene_type:complete
MSKTEKMAFANTKLIKNKKVSDNQGKTERPPKEIGGPKGLEPTRYGDWEKNGRCSDF